METYLTIIFSIILILLSLFLLISFTYIISHIYHIYSEKKALLEKQRRDIDFNNIILLKNSYNQEYSCILCSNAGLFVFCCPFRDNLYCELKDCQHIYHYDCIMKLLEKNQSCPICLHERDNKIVII